MALGSWFGSGATVAMLVLAACSTRTAYVDCDYVITRCRTVCDYWCDGWGCYPVCYDQCWDECRQDPTPPPPSEPAPPAPAPAPSGDPPPSDAGAPAPSRPAVLCQPCGANEDCGTGSLCIVRGGDAGAGFCGTACTATSDCPEGFSCAPVGATRQCLPVSGACE